MGAALFAALAVPLAQPHAGPPSRRVEAVSERRTAGPRAGHGHGGARR